MSTSLINENEDNDFVHGLASDDFGKRPQTLILRHTKQLR